MINNRVFFRFTDASKNNNVANEFPSLKVNPNSVKEGDLSTAEIDGKKFPEFEMPTSERGRFQGIISKAAQYDRQIIDVAMLMIDKLDIKSGESFLTLVKIILSYSKGNSCFLE